MNAFNIANPERCTCRVMDYRFNDSSMVIRVLQPTFSDQKVTLYLLLQGVQYFEGPVGWEGANFQTETPEACLDLFRKVGRYSDYDDAVLMKMFRLFRVPILSPGAQQTAVRIIAASGLLTQESKGTFTDKLGQGTP